MPARVARLGLRVRDLAASHRFYARLFGGVEAETDASGRVRSVRLAATPSGQGDVIQLIRGRTAGAVSAFDHFGVEVAGPEAVDLIYRRACDEDVRALAPHDDDEGRRCVVFDPDGYRIEVFCTRPDASEAGD